MSENKNPIPGRIYNAADGGYVCGAIDIIDDVKGKSQQVINQETDAAIEDRYTKGETYNKTELNNLITTPDQQFVTLTAQSGDTLADIFNGITGAADTVYRVGSWDGSAYNVGAYCEYAWDGTNFVPLSKKQPGIDDDPTAGSDNFVRSDGIYSAIKKENLIINTLNRFKDDYNDISDIFNLLKKDFWELGSIGGNPVADVPSTTRIRTKSDLLIPIDNKIQLSIAFSSPLMKIDLYEYDVNFNFIKDSSWLTENTYKKLDTNTAYIRFVAAYYSSDSAIDLEALTEVDNWGISITKRYKLPQQNQLALSHAVKKYYDNDGIFYFDFANDFEIGDIDNSTGNSKTDQYNRTIRTKNYIEIEKNSNGAPRTIIAKVLNTISADWNEARIYLYDESYNYINWYGLLNRELLLPSTVKYVKFTFWNHWSIPASEKVFSVDNIVIYYKDFSNRSLLTNLNAIESELHSVKDIEYGSLSGSGAEINSTIRVRSIGFMTFKEGMIIIPRDGYKIELYEYGIDRGFIKYMPLTWSNSPILVKNSSRLYKILIAKNDDSAFTYSEITNTNDYVAISSEKANAVSVLTQNVWNWIDTYHKVGNTLQDFIDAWRNFISKYNPNIIALQEYRDYLINNENYNAETLLLNNWFDIKSNVGSGAADVKAFGYNGKIYEYRNEWIGDSRSMIIGYIKIEDKVVCIANIHPHPSDQSKRDSELASAYSKIQNEEYLILMGDMNQEDMSFWTSKGYKAANNSFFGRFPTWDDGGQITDPTQAEAVDNIIVTPNIRITKVEMTELVTSDHHGLYAKLVIL